MQMCKIAVFTISKKPFKDNTFPLFNQSESGCVEIEKGQDKVISTNTVNSKCRFVQGVKDINNTCT